MSSQIIRRFRLEGVMSSKYLPRAQEAFKKELETQMRDEGFIPLYDIDPTFKTKYIAKNDTYEYVYTMQGVHIGEDKSWHFQGVTNDKAIPNSTPTPPTK